MCTSNLELSHDVLEIRKTFLTGNIHSQNSNSEKFSERILPKNKEVETLGEKSNTELYQNLKNIYQEKSNQDHLIKRNLIKNVFRLISPGSYVFQETENINDTNSPEKKARNDVHLLKWKDMPAHLKFNPYIKTGYRPMLSVWGCLKSLFYLHNETFNIITHGIPIFCVLFKTPSITLWSHFELSFLSWCHVIGIISPWIGSFIYHLFMNLDRPPDFYHRLLQLDMLGIWLCQSIGAMPMIFTFSYCFHYFTKCCCILFYSAVSLWGLYKAMLAVSPWERRVCFLLPFLLRILMYGLRLMNFGGGDTNAILHLILQDLIAVIGATIGALHIPEKWFPGQVDKCWNSHNIMHIFVVAAVYSMHKATMHDLRWIDNVHCS